MKKSLVKDDNVKKILVRNAIVPAKSRGAAHEKKHVQFAENSEPSEVESKDFSTPEFCSILRLVDEIKKVKLRSPTDFIAQEECRKACNVNFQPHEKLYKDLISVDVPVEDSHSKVKTKYPTKNITKKDLEPNFKDLLKYSLQEEYAFTSFVVPEVKKPVPVFDGRSIYNMTNKYKVDTFY